MPATTSPREHESIDAGFGRILEGNAPEVVATAHALRAAVHAAAPEIVEVIDHGNGLLALGTSAGMRDLLFAIIPHRAHVNLQLADGVELPNESDLIEAARSAPVRRVIEAQIAHRHR